jgi:hypothetical protein
MRQRRCLRPLLLPWTVWPDDGSDGPPLLPISRIVMRGNREEAHEIILAVGMARRDGLIRKA